MRGETTSASELQSVVPRLEGVAKVTGSTEYVHHVSAPGVLHAKLVRSPHAQARLLGVDAARAAAQPRVRAVLTAADVRRVMPQPFHGPAFWDQPVLAVDRVRYWGEPVAVVVAEDPHVAADAAALVTGNYEPVPGVFDERQAIREDSPLVHDAIKPAGTFPDLAQLTAVHGTNVAMVARLRRGETQAAFASADHVFEDVFRTQQCMQTPLEPLVAMAEANEDGLVVDTSSQNPSYVRMELARLLGWPENRVRVRTAFLGGAFGAKLYIKLEALVAACALVVGRPVKLGLTMEEQFTTITRQGSTARIRTGVMRDGAIVARECEIWWNNGAYADIGPRVAHKSALVAAGPYDIANLKVDSCVVYTNLPPAGAMRGFGIPQIAFAHECQADIIAAELGLDAVEFRRRNLLCNGRPQATGTILEHSALPEVLDALRRRMRWGEPFDRGGGSQLRGRGIAIAVKACLSPTTSVARVSMSSDGSCSVATGTVDMGQGSDTVLAQIAGQVLGLSPARLRIIHPDTDATPYDMGTIGSRSTFHMGNAVREAAQSLRAQLLELAAARWACSTGELELRDGKVIGRDGRSLTYGDAMVADFGAEAGTLVGTGYYTPPFPGEDHETGQSEHVTPFWMSGGTGIELEVDTETGRIAVTRLVNVADGGTVLNPELARVQITGAAIMQLGNTLSEELRFDEAGRLINGSLRDYKIPALADVPRSIETEFVEVAHPDGPYGAKGLGETGTFGVSAAVGNAVHDATGVRIRELPLNPERVLRALRRADGAPLAER